MEFLWNFRCKCRHQSINDLYFPHCLPSDSLGNFQNGLQAKTINNNQQEIFPLIPLLFFSYTEEKNRRIIIKQYGNLKLGVVMKNLKLMAVAALMIVAGSAQASFLIEPHLAYNVSGTGDNTVAGVKVEHEYSGAQYGARVGGQYLGFMAGLDYTLSKPDLKSTALGTTSTTSLDNKELGIFVGYNLPILLRAWGTYYFDTTSKYSSGEFSGHTIELGVGFTALPFLSLNAMYRNVTLDENKSGGTTTKLTGSAEYNLHEFVVGVSLPINL